MTLTSDAESEATWTVHYEFQSSKIQEFILKGLFLELSCPGSVHF